VVVRVHKGLACNTYSCYNTKIKLKYKCACLSGFFFCKFSITQIHTPIHWRQHGVLRFAQGHVVRPFNWRMPALPPELQVLLFQNTFLYIRHFSTSVMMSYHSGGELFYKHKQLIELSNCQIIPKSQHQIPNKLVTESTWMSSRSKMEREMEEILNQVLP